jgi:hypothetical protein
VQSTVNGQQPAGKKQKKAD